jgi:PAS domain S-box-containing protein
MQVNLPLIANFTMKVWACIVSLCAFLLAFAPAQAQTEDPFRVLVLHGAWSERLWDSNFDQQFSTALTERINTPFELSFQRIDSGPLADERVVEFYTETVNGIVSTAGVDLIVAVLPAAVAFVKTLNSYMTLPMVLTLPSDPAEYAGLPTNNFRVVQPSADDAIRNTVAAAIQLHPDATIIEVFSGPPNDDFKLVDVARKVVEQDFSEYELIMHSSMPMAELEAYLGSLKSNSIVLTLPGMSFAASEPEKTSQRLSQLAAASTKPLYGFADPFLGSGIAGGYFYTVEEYAIASADAVVSLVDDIPFDPAPSGDYSSYLFDYDQVQRHNLQLNRLEMPYAVRNQPGSLLQDYRNTVLVVGVVFLLFGVVLYFLFRALKLSESAKGQLQLSESQARESQSRYELLTKNTLDVIWTWDQEQRQTTYCSPSIEQLTGYTVSEFLRLGIRDIMTEESAANTLALVFAPSREAGMFDVELVCKDGSKTWCEVAAQSMAEPGKQSNQWVGITRDISKRKQAENERLALEGQLLQVQKFESLGTLAGGIAHDFNNMLGVMIGLNELLKLKVADDPAAIDIIGKLMATADRAKDLVGQILAFSRQSNLHKVNFNLGELAADSLQLIRSGMPKSVKLEQDLGSSPIEVVADSNQVAQVLVIILTNAFEALEQEQGEIDFSISEVEISSKKECLHGHLEPGMYAKVTVSDNGLGVSQDRIDKIFDPFYTSKDLGNGMGLSIARGIVMAHNGGIDFRSTPFKGSTVAIYLPAHVAKVSTLPQSNRVSSLTRSTILLIDDQTDLLETVGMMLDVLGYDCIQCSDPRQAMDIIAETANEFDLVITDYSMPNVTGLDIANLCAQKRSSVPVILATGYNDSSILLSTIDGLEHHVLNKPFGFNELKVMLNSVLSSESS